MKRIAFILIIFCAFTTKAQNLVMNGSFEYNNSPPEQTDCFTDISNNTYAALMDSSSSYSTINMNIVYFNRCLSIGNMMSDSIAYDGDFSLFIMARDTVTSVRHKYSMAFNLELSQALLSGSYYKLSYYQKVLPVNITGTYYGPGALEIGISEYDTSFGVAVDTIAYNDYNWEKIEFVFKATIPAKYLTIEGFILIGQDAAIVDNFVLTLDSFAVLGVNEQVLEKQLLKITDVLGRESKPTPNVPLFYRYDDGTVEKRIIVE
jgi:hypothetical protein